MSIASIIGVGLIAAILSVTLRQIRPEYALLLSLAAGIFILLSLLTDISGLVDRLGAMSSRASIPAEYIKALFKALGICFVTQIASDACKDAGESAISAKIEMAGKIAVLIVSLPLFEQALSVVYNLMTI